ERHTRSTRDWSSDVCSSDLLEKADRYPSVAEFSADLRKFVEHRPVEARRGGAAYALNKLMKRRPVLMAFTVTCLAALITTTALRSEERRVGKEVRYRG